MWFDLNTEIRILSGVDSPPCFLSCAEPIFDEISGCGAGLRSGNAIRCLEHALHPTCPRVLGMIWVGVRVSVSASVRGILSVSVSVSIRGIFSFGISVSVKVSGYVEKRF